MLIPTDRFASSRGRSYGNGFTLIELMTVIVVAAVLATLSTPAYLEQIRKARRLEAVVMTLQVQQAQERWRATCQQYATLIGVANSNDCVIGTSGLAISAPVGARYVYELAGVTAVGYSLTATALRGSDQSKDRVAGTSCNVLTVTVTGGSATQLPLACWSR